MKTLRTNKGPFRERPYLTESEVDNTCVDELHRFGLLPSEPGPVRIDRYIERRFDSPAEYEDLPDGILGLTRFGSKGVQTIVISSTLDSDKSVPGARRVRATLAHEAGHGLFHTHLFVLGEKQPLFGDWSDGKKPKVLCRDQDHGTYKGDWWELQANMAIGGLLMPRPLVLKAMSPFLSAVGLLGGQTIQTKDRERAVRELSDIFDVNPKVARIRLDNLIPASSSSQLSL
jgi:hypothetical protein